MFNDYALLKPIKGKKLIIMFNFGKEESLQKEQEEREHLLSLTEKELMVEAILELKKINSKCDKIARKIVVHS